MAPQFNIVSNIPTTSFCFNCQASSFNPYTTSYYSSRITTKYNNPPNNNSETNNLRSIVIAGILLTSLIIIVGSFKLVGRIGNRSPEPTETNIQSPRPAETERKNLNDDELTLYPIVVVTEKMLKSDNNVRGKSSPTIKKSKHIVDDPNDDGISKLLKSASNIISNASIQVPAQSADTTCDHKKENSNQENSDQDTGLPANTSLNSEALPISTNRQRQNATQDQSSFFFASAATNNSLLLNRSNLQTHNDHHMQSTNNSDSTSSSHHNCHYVDNSFSSPPKNDF
ncbi:hypothetical protein AYI69_g8813 [Smittium culicis]|uniref:Uncharacterized protein n=1 Tax=Smittium culicis TaxID=133412 RepID=A0A1R1XGW7_9FUNG|nr:hypothetical protein AYI69_g8813 [Smittium culicis]